ncbi:gamma secretase subunit PEN 2 [Trichuris trichiura]|uniref:Gamma-secretase subunit PEN-2 n=1 Tax=Trichuris trichiura TaxID=36087 RepID=A0A077Z6I8_TRITR|nr:gamma secretase subunit PEN 2 [Trichuris trichiura]
MNRLPDTEKLRICKLYFVFGLFGLPSIWLVNGIWFFGQAFFRQPPFPEQCSIRSYVILSLIGASLWIIGFAFWANMFLSVRISWGATGDEMSLIIPFGEL